MLKKLLVILAKRKLENSLKQEEIWRESAEYMRKVIIPRHEAELRQREIDQAADSYLKAFK